MNSKRTQMTQPPDWLDAWKAKAAKEGLSLSAWIGEQCNKGLTKKEQAKLSERPPAHCPKKQG